MRGTLLDWDPATYRATVRLPDGTVLTDPPMVETVDVRTWQTGDMVLVYDGVILGRLMRPVL
jgi:hypothetical protein